MANTLYWLCGQLAQADASLSVAAVPALLHLKAADERGAPLTRIELTDYLRIEPDAVTELLEKLRDLNLVSRLARGKYSLTVIGLGLLLAASKPALVQVHELNGRWRVEHGNWPMPEELAEQYKLDELVVEEHLETISSLGSFGGYCLMKMARVGEGMPGKFRPAIV